MEGGSSFSSDTSNADCAWLSVRLAEDYLAMMVHVYAAGCPSKRGDPLGSSVNSEH